MSDGARRGLRDFALLALVGFAIYAPALRGEFVSDDFYYLWSSPSVANPSWRGVLDILDPFGSSALSILNYSPVHLLLHTLEVELFGRSPLGYHVVNVLVHAAVSLLLARLFERIGSDRRAALGAALVFVCHPANVEAVAWISQLKTTSSLALALAGVLALEKRAGLATVLFALALLAKAQAIALLGFVAAIACLRASGRAREAMPVYSLRWVGVWVALAVGYSLLELSIFHAASDAIAPLHADPMLRVANWIAVAGRYAAMIATGTGLATFHQPDPIESLSSPWVWGTLALVAAAIARALFALRSGSAEIAWWVLAAVAYAPISQLLPFLHPIGDRYVYYLLPAALGVALSLARRTDPLRFALAATALAVAFGVAARDRADVWTTSERVFADSARRYPNGLKAHMLRAREAAREGDAVAACESLARARARGFTGLQQLFADSALRRLRGEPCFDALVREIAEERAAHFAAQPPSQLALANLAFAQRALGDAAASRASLERAIALGGPMTASLERQLRALSAGSEPAHPRALSR